MNIDAKYNINQTTPLCAIMDKYGSDKGTVCGRNAHNYTLLYHEMFKNRINDKMNVFELGVGTNNPHKPSNMYGIDISYAPGASLRAWREYFPMSDIYSADIDTDILFNEERIKTFYCDQRDPESIKELWNKIDDVDFDIIIEDGLHEFDAHVTFFENSIHKLKIGGLFVIEDIWMINVPKIANKIGEWSRKYPNLKFRLERIEHHKQDNNLFIVQKF